MRPGLQFEQGLQHPIVEGHSNSGDYEILQIKNINFVHLSTSDHLHFEMQHKAIA